MTATRTLPAAAVPIGATVRIQGTGAVVTITVSDPITWPTS